MNRALVAALVGFACWIGSQAPAVARSNGNTRRQVAGARFSVGGAVESPRDWTVAQLKEELATRVSTVQYDLHGEHLSATVVPLLAVVETAKPVVDPKRKNDAMSLSVIVTGKDGYAVAFAMGELLADAGARDVWIAMDRNGAPLPDKEAPVRLIVPGDKKPARWLFGVRSIRVIANARPAAATRP